MKKATASLLVLLLLSLHLSPALADDSDIFSRNIQPNVMILLDNSGSMTGTVPSAAYVPATNYSGSRTRTRVYQAQTRQGSTSYSTYRDTVAQVPNADGADPAAARTALDLNNAQSSGYWTGPIGGSTVRLFIGNYLNYANSTGSGTEQKIVIARRVIGNLINNVQGVRFGVMKFTPPGSPARPAIDPLNRGEMVAPIGTDKATMVAAVNAIPAETWTPTGEQIRDVGLYYKGQFGYSSPIQLECQPNFALVISDGVWNNALNPASQGTTLFTTDHAPSLPGAQNVIVHTVGFAHSQADIDAGGLTALQDTAKNGGGNFYTADSAAQLEGALADAIRQIIAGTFTFASPVIPTTSAAGTNRAYLAAFQSDPIRPFWRGYLSAYTRDTNGLVRVDANGIPDTNYRVWEAGDLLRQKSASSRTIHTVKNGAMVAFTTGNMTDALLGVGTAGTITYEFRAGSTTTPPTYTRDFTLALNNPQVGANPQVTIMKEAGISNVPAPPAGIPCPATCYAYMKNGNDPTNPPSGAPTSNHGWVGNLNGAALGSGFSAYVLAVVPGAAGTTKDQVVNFIRGIDAFDEDRDGNVTEERAWKLGDIFHSSPVVVGPPILPSADPTYKTFKETNSGRVKVLIAGANDGMLHAFRESDGQELWAFIPPDLLSALKHLGARTGQHDFYVDSSPIVADVKFQNGTWHTIVIFGERRGGRYYHALDITNTTNPQYLWSFTDTRMGETWSEPAIGKRSYGNNLLLPSWARNTTRYVAYVGGGYDTESNNASGKGIFVIDLERGEKIWEWYNFPSPPAPSGPWNDMNFSLAGNPTIADTNSDGLVDHVYIGDVGGQLWKFTDGGSLQRFFAANPSQANPPAIGEYYPAQAIYNAPVLSFDDQGQLWVFFGTGDRYHPNNTSGNRFFGIKDNTTPTSSTLTPSDLVDVTSADATASQGWYVRLGTDEKVLASADVFDKIVYFSTFTPTTLVACGTGGGSAKLYAVQMLTGYAALDWATGSLLDPSDSSRIRYTDVGSGIPSSPTVVIGASGSGSGGKVTINLVTVTSSQQLENNAAPALPSLKRVIYWREVR